MENETRNHKNAYYKVITTTEDVSGVPTTMYGVEGFSEGESVSLPALSSDRKRVVDLVASMNCCELELCQLCEVVNDFMYECYGIKTSKF